MRKGVRIIAVCVVAVAVLLLSACNGENPASGEGGKVGNKEALANLSEQDFPIVKEPIKLKFFAGKAPTTAPDWNDVAIFNEYEKRTNMDIEWQMVPFETLDEKRNIALASGDYPDAFHTARVPAADLFKYGQQGVFIPLNDLIDKYAPNFKDILEKYPEVKKAVTMPDGNIYSFPSIYAPAFKSFLFRNKLWVKKEWLDKIGMDIPQTTEEFHQLLKAIKEKDPNGNGKADEIAFGAGEARTLPDFLLGAFGVSTTGDNYIDVDPKTGKTRFYRIDGGYKQLLQYVNKLYKEGLIDQEIFTFEKNPTAFQAKAAKGVYGTIDVLNPYEQLGLKGYVAIPPLKGPHGDQMYTRVSALAPWKGAFAITNKNEHPEATVRWIDYFYSDEGMKNFFMGIEGKSYTETKDGKVEYTKEITDDPSGKSFEQVLTKYVTWMGGSYPSMVVQKYFKGGESSPDSLEASQKIEPYAIKEVWPGFNYTAEEEQRLAPLRDDIHTYADEMRSRFISGETPFSEWDKYVQTIKKMGLDEYLEINEAAYKRYKESK